MFVNTKNKKLSTEASLILAILMTEKSTGFLTPLCKESISTILVHTIYHVRIVSLERKTIIIIICGLCK